MNTKHIKLQFVTELPANEGGVVYTRHAVHCPGCGCMITPSQVEPHLSTDHPLERERLANALDVNSPAPGCTICGQPVDWDFSNKRWSVACTKCLTDAAPSNASTVNARLERMQRKLLELNQLSKTYAWISAPFEHATDESALFHNLIKMILAYDQIPDELRLVAFGYAKTIANTDNSQEVEDANENNG